jgi:PAS domain S-box-containing protein
LSRYGVAVAAVTTLTLVKLLLAPVIERESPFIFFLASVLVSAWYGGLGPGLLATVLAVPLIDFFFLEPVHTLDFGLASGGSLSLLLLLGEGIAISLLMGSLYSAQEVARARARDLQVSEARYRRIVETAHEGIWGRDAEGRIDYINARMTQLLGYSAAEMLGRPWWDFLQTQDRSAAQGSWERRRRGVTEQFEFRFRRKDGSDMWAIISANPFFNDEGVFIGALGMLTDVTQRKEAEEELRRAKEELELRVIERTAELRKANAQLQIELAERRQAEAALQRYAAEIEDLYDHAPCGYHSLDPEGRIVRVNATELAWLGYHRDEVLGKPFADFLTPESAKEFHEIFPLLKERGWVRNVEPNLVRKDGTILSVLVNATVVRDAAGQFVMSRSTAMDLTERKRAEAELHQARAAAEAANRAKSAFLANVSHEIRNPMSALLFTIDLLLNSELTAKQVEYLRMMKGSTNSLLSVINDLLDFSKIEAGKLDLDNIPFHLGDCLARALKAQALRAHQKGLELACYLDPSVPEVLVGDPNRLGQIILNLVGNAVKFTLRGEIMVRVAAPSPQAEEVELHIAVSDTGIGIPADKLQAVFQPFEQADTSTTRHYGGTGLGLSIAVKLVALMGGRIWVESAVGQGSTFHFTVRFGVSQSLTAGLSQVELAGLRELPVLVVDDNATAGRILVETLRNWRLRPTAVDGARSALATLRQAAAAGKPFPLVLLDAHVPDMDSFALAAQVQHEPELVEATIMMLSTTDGPREVARCRELGIAAWLTKPILPSELRAALLDVRGQRPVETAGGAPELAPAAVHPLRVLVTEDNPITQILMVDLLEKLGHTVVTAGSGVAALATLERQPFDVVLMDVQMPAMSGFEVTAQIRAREQTTGNHVAIIAVTAYAMKGDRERCLEAGMDDYLAKPVQALELVEALNRLVPARPATLSSDGQNGGGTLSTCQEPAR